MRRRLLWSTLAAATVAIVLLGVPLAVAVRGLLVDQARETARQEAEQTVAILERQTSSLTESTVLLQVISEAIAARLTLIDATGRVAVDAGDAEISLDGPAAVVVPVRLGNGDFVLGLAHDQDALQGLIRRSWVAIGALAVLALVAAAGLALRQGRVLAAPMEQLARSARRLGDGDFSARAPRSGLPEADEVGTALDSTASRLAVMLERSRSFGADASHQLRTPLTALRLDLEALGAGTAGDASLVDAAMAEVDRLEATIDELLTLAQPPVAEDLTDLGVLAAGRLAAWQSLARSQSRQVAFERTDAPLVRARPAAIGQALQVLLDNALAHGRGTVTVSVHAVSAGRPAHGAWVRLCVRDEGDGIAGGVLPAPGAGESGRGLPLASSLVESEGGRLRMEQTADGFQVCLLLPGGAARSGEPG